MNTNLAIIRNTPNGVRMWLDTDFSGWADISTQADFNLFISQHAVELVIIEADHRYVPATITNALICYAYESNTRFDTRIIDDHHTWTHKNLASVQ